jgi:hypothetical protein
MSLCHLCTTFIATALAISTNELTCFASRTASFTLVAVTVLNEAEFKFEKKIGSNEATVQIFLGSSDSHRTFVAHRHL